MWARRIDLLGASILVGLTLGTSAVVAQESPPVCGSSSRSSTGVEDLFTVSEEAP